MQQIGSSDGQNALLDFIVKKLGDEVSDGGEVAANGVFDLCSNFTDGVAVTAAAG